LYDNTVRHRANLKNIFAKHLKYPAKIFNSGGYVGTKMTKEYFRLASSKGVRICYLTNQNPRPIPDLLSV